MPPILRKGDLLCRWSWRWLFGRCRRREQIRSCLLSAVTFHGGRSWRHRILQATGSNRFAQDNAPRAPGSCRVRVAQCPRCSGDQATSLGTSEGCASSRSLGNRASNHSASTATSDTKVATSGQAGRVGERCRHGSHAPSVLRPSCSRPYRTCHGRCAPEWMKRAKLGWASGSEYLGTPRAALTRS
jgi:hypothetical protein